MAAVEGLSDELAIEPVGDALLADPLGLIFEIMDAEADTAA
jgi:hypothetical protein